MANEDNTATGIDATLSLHHLMNAVKVIDFACEAGAFKGWEVISQAKSVRDDLEVFVKQIEASMEADSAAQAAASTVTDTQDATAVVQSEVASNTTIYDTPVQNAPTTV